MPRIEVENKETGETETIYQYEVQSEDPPRFVYTIDSDNAIRAGNSVEIKLVGDGIIEFYEGVVTMSSPEDEKTRVAIQTQFGN